MARGAGGPVRLAAAQLVELGSQRIKPRIGVGRLEGAEVIAEPKKEQGERKGDDGRNSTTLRHNDSKFGS